MYIIFFITPTIEAIFLHIECGRMDMCLSDWCYIVEKVLLFLRGAHRRVGVGNPSAFRIKVCTYRNIILITMYNIITFTDNTFLIVSLVAKHSTC